MIKGFRFTNQLSNAEVDSRIHQEFLNKNDGIFYGMELSKTTNSITINEGLCEVAGRPIAVVDNETVNVSTENLFCLLVLEIDLSKESTKDMFNQVNFKILSSSINYPSVTQQDINRYNGENEIYQLEFARFKTNTAGIYDFKDTRKFLNFNGIYSQVKAKCEEIIEQIKQELANVKNGSVYVLKNSDGTINAKVNSNDITNRVTKQTVTKENNDGKIVLTARKCINVVSLEFKITTKTANPMLSFAGMIPAEYRPNQTISLGSGTSISIFTSGQVTALNVDDSIANTVFTFIKD